MKILVILLVMLGNSAQVTQADDKLNQPIGCESTLESAPFFDPKIEFDENEARFQLTNPNSFMGRVVNAVIFKSWIAKFLGVQDIKEYYQSIAQHQKRVTELGLNYLNVSDQLQAVETFPRSPSIHEDFLKSFKITNVYDPGILSKVPKQGPLVIVSNHPLSGIEGIAIAEAIAKIRPDVKILANHILGSVPQLQEHLILANPMSKHGLRNRAMHRETKEWLANGHALIVFPAGAVSDRLPLWNRGDKDSRESIDIEWNSHIFKVAADTNAAILPVYVPGEPGLIMDLLKKLGRSLSALKPFQKVGDVFTASGFSLILREMARLKGKKLFVNFGKVMSPDRVKELYDPREKGVALVDNVRRQVYGLKDKHKKQASTDYRVPHEKILDEVQSLPEDHVLLNKGRYKVFYTRGFETPYIMAEIGRLREISFRTQEEGSDRSADLDRYDEFYTQVVLWDQRQNRIEGGYRIADVQAIRKAFGEDHLYTKELFRIEEELMQGEYSSGLELGRTYVRKGAKGSGLLFLWKGIGEYIVRNPRIRYTFGPVSISQAISKHSKALIYGYLFMQYSHPDNYKNLVEGQEMPDFKIYSKAKVIEVLSKYVESKTEKGLPKKPRGRGGDGAYGDHGVLISGGNALVENETSLPAPPPPQELPATPSIAGGIAGSVAASGSVGESAMRSARIAGATINGMRIPSSDIEPFPIGLQTESSRMTALIRAVEEHEGPRGVAVNELIKHYFVKMAARIRAIHKDVEFGSVDGFIETDLLDIPRARLEMVLGGKPNAQKYLEYWSEKTGRNLLVEKEPNREN